MPDVANPFPRRATDTVRVDSIAEEYAFLNAYPGLHGPWRIVSQTLSIHDGQPSDRLVIQAEEAVQVEEEIAFDIVSFSGTPGLRRLDGFTTEHLDRLMRAAADFAADNAPTHPGSLPRFPVPSARFPGRLDVPLAILATDGEQRGLFAPPLVVTFDYPSGDPYGVGPFPAFDAAAWPPPRLGDWPPPPLAGMPRLQLQGTVARFSACVTRLLDAWFTGTDYPHRHDEAAEAQALWARLDPPAMLNLYGRLNEDYLRWLDARTDEVGPEDAESGADV